MITVYDVPSAALIEKVAKYLEDNIDEVNPPTWAVYVKTGVQIQRPPDQHEWWYTRCASLLRKVYCRGPIGVSRIRKEYGGRTGKGSVGKHKAPGGGAIIRNAFQQLERAGLIGTIESKGRILTSKGTSLLDRLAYEVKNELEKKIPTLKKYG